MMVINNNVRCLKFQGDMKQRLEDHLTSDSPQMADLDKQMKEMAKRYHELSVATSEVLAKIVLTDLAECFDELFTQKWYVLLYNCT